MKVTVVGAGNVGATCAEVVARRDFADEVILVDIKEGVAEGKALDIWQTSPIHGFDTRVKGVTDNYEATAGSDIVVITSGLPRKPGMSRDDLIQTNAGIVNSVTEKAIKYSPDAIIIVVSNPLDVMTYAAYKTAGKPSQKVFGMAGILDTARYRAFLAEKLDCSPKDIQALLLGGHGDTMVPLPRYTTVSGIPVEELLDKETLDVMTYAAYKTAGKPSQKVFGMAGILDTARYRAFLAEKLDCSPKDIQALLLGGHGDTMVPLPRYTTVSGIPVEELLDKETLDAVAERAKYGGGELVKLMGTSAWYAPGGAAAQMVEAIALDQKRTFPVCTWLEGEYGMKDIYLGVPVVLGKDGIEKIVEVELNEDEKALLDASSKAVKSVMDVYDNLSKQPA